MGNGCLENRKRSFILNSEFCVSKFPLKAIAACGFFLLAVLSNVRFAHAQEVIEPIAPRSSTWGTVTDVSVATGGGVVALMPRVYYSDPESTVGWKGRWHVSSLMPAMTMTTLTFLVDGPIRKSIESTRPGCTLEQTKAALPGSNCESFGGPSTHAFASWGAMGTGLGIFLMDTLKHSDGRFNLPAFVGNVFVPLSAAVVTSVGRSASPDDARSYEKPGQIAAGAVSGLLTGLLVGTTYAWLQRPSCGYGDSIVCW